MFEILSNNYERIVFSTLCIYLFIIIAIRLFGKKELAQLSVVDLVFILLISNAVQNAMVGPDSTLSGGLVAATTLFVVNYVFKNLKYKLPKFGKLLEGDAIMLIYQGKILETHLEKARITHEELMEAIREHGVSSVKEVDLAILEVDGNISVLSNAYQKKTSKRRRAHKVISKEIS